MGFSSFVIDDEKWIGIDMKKTVNWEKAGFELPTFYQDPILAYNKLIANPVDVIFTDIRMPSFSGIDLIRSLREKKIDSEIVIISAYEDFVIAQQSIRLNVFDFCLKPINPKRINEILQSLSLKLNHKKKSNLNETCDDTQIIIKKIIHYLEQNITQKITLDDVANKFFINKSYVCYLFRKNYDKTFSQYVNNLKIERAKELLANTNLSNEKIAEYLSYCDYYYFTRVFKNNTGISPFEYRKSIK
jgi:two-component system response regulator YesN